MQVPNVSLIQNELILLYQNTVFWFALYERTAQETGVTPDRTVAGDERLTRSTFAMVLEPAWRAATSTKNVLGGWRKSGLVPFGPTVVLIQIGVREPAEIAVEFEYRQEEALTLQYEQQYATVQALSAERARTHELYVQLAAAGQSASIDTAGMASRARATMGAPVRLLSV